MSVSRALAVICLALAAADEGEEECTSTSSAALMQLNFRGTTNLETLAKDSATARTMLKMDTDRNGRIDAAEVAHYARAQGYDPRQVSRQFASLDIDGDGTLDQKEIAIALLQTGQEIPETHRGASELQAAHEAYRDTVAPAKASLLQEDQMESSSREQPGPESTDTFKDEDVGKLSEEELDVTRVKTSAEKAADELIGQMSIEQKSRTQAETQEKKAIELRAKASEVARAAEEKAREAGKKASADALEQVMRDISDMDKKAEDAQLKATSFRESARLALEEAQRFTKESSKAFAQSTEARAI